MGLRDRSAAHFRQYRGQNLTVADKTIKRIIDYPIVSHIDAQVNADGFYEARTARSEEHTSELQSLMRTSYAVFCLKNKITRNKINQHSTCSQLYHQYQHTP